MIPDWKVACWYAGRYQRDLDSWEEQTDRDLMKFCKDRWWILSLKWQSPAVTQAAGRGAGEQLYRNLLLGPGVQWAGWGPSVCPRISSSLGCMNESMAQSLWELIILSTFENTSTYCVWTGDSQHRKDLKLEWVQWRVAKTAGGWSTGPKRSLGSCGFVQPVEGMSLSRHNCSHL